MVVDTESVPVFINDYEDIRYVYSIMLLPPVTLFNYLPFPLKYSVYNQMSDKVGIKWPDQLVGAVVTKRIDSKGNRQA